MLPDYTLTIFNSQGASETTAHASKTSVRKVIRTCDAKDMKARVWNSDGELIWDGPALSFK